MLQVTHYPYVCIVYASAAVHIDCISCPSRIRKPGTVGWLAVDATPTRPASLIDHVSSCRPCRRPLGTHVTCHIGLPPLFRSVRCFGKSAICMPSEPYKSFCSVQRVWLRRRFFGTAQTTEFLVRTFRLIGCIEILPAMCCMSLRPKHAGMCPHLISNERQYQYPQARKLAYTSHGNNSSGLQILYQVAMLYQPYRHRLRSPSPLPWWGGIGGGQGSGSEQVNNGP